MGDWRELLRGQGDVPDAAWVHRMAKYYQTTCGFNINPAHYEAKAIVEGRDPALESLWEHVEREQQEVSYG